MATKALLVGINDYVGAPLAGCINDVTDMAHFITDHCGFDPKSVRLLTDRRATAEAILERLNWLVSNLHPGDRILFHFSGHGTQLSTRDSKGEVDGLDECVCPQNFAWTDETAIRDKQFHLIFDRIPAGVNAVWISDSCHSGDMIREASGLGGRRDKRLIPPADIGWRVETAQRCGFSTRGIQGVAQDLPNIVLIAGCRDNQTSADSNFGGRANGALTYFLLRELNKPDGLTTPMPILIQQVRDGLKNANYSQVPQLEGPAGITGRTFL